MRSYKTWTFGTSADTFVLVCCSLFLFILSSGCGGQDTDHDAETVDTGSSDTGVQPDGNMTDTKDSSDGNGDNTLSRSEVKQKICQECQNRDKKCPSDMENDMKEEYRNPDIGQLADKFCQSKNPCDKYKSKSYLVDEGVYRCKNEGRDVGKCVLKFFTQKGQCGARCEQAPSYIFSERAEKLKQKGEKKFHLTASDGVPYTCTLTSK